MNPQRLALVDVADAGADALIKQQLAKGWPIRLPSSLDHGVELERLTENVRTKMSDRLPRVGGQLHDRGGKTDGDGVLEVQHGGRPPFGLPPSLARPVQVPGAGHAHVRVQDETTIELHQQMLALWVDPLEPAAGQTAERRGPRVDEDFSL